MVTAVQRELPLINPEKDQHTKKIELSIELYLPRNLDLVFSRIAQFMKLSIEDLFLQIINGKFEYLVTDDEFCWANFGEPLHQLMGSVYPKSIIDKLPQRDVIRNLSPFTPQLNDPNYTVITTWLNDYQKKTATDTVIVQLKMALPISLYEMMSSLCLLLNLSFEEWCKNQLFHTFSMIYLDDMFCWSTFYNDYLQELNELLTIWIQDKSRIHS